MKLQQFCKYFNIFHKEIIFKNRSFINEFSTKEDIIIRTIGGQNPKP